MKMKNMGNSHSMPSKSWRKTQRERGRKLVFESSRGVKSVALSMEGRFHGQTSAPFSPIRVVLFVLRMTGGVWWTLDEGRGYFKAESSVFSSFSVYKNTLRSQNSYFCNRVPICLKRTAVPLVRSDNRRCDCSVCFDFLMRVRNAALGWGPAFGRPPAGA